MVVMATWISVISDDLPKTSYVTLVDIWFVWHLTITFLIGIYHIFLDRISKSSIQFKVSMVATRIQSPEDKHTALGNGNRNIHKINVIGIWIFAIVNITFYATYFYVSLK